MTKLPSFARCVRIIALVTSVASPASAGGYSGPPDDGDYGYNTNNVRQPYYPPGADCWDYMIPVQAQWQAFPFTATNLKWKNDFDLVNFLSLATTRAGANYPSPLGAARHRSATFHVAASFCTPKHSTPRAKTVIFATHGIGPARAHWNSPFEPQNYNFVQWAIGQGYSVFFYDRVGCGASEKISGYDAQLTQAAGVIQSLSQIVRSGRYTGNLGKPHKLALIGFSFGSFATHTAITLTPNIADAVILTGVGFNTTGLNANGLVRSFVPRIAALQNPRLYGDRDLGYVTWVDEFAQALNYFKKPNYDPATAAFAEAAKQPFGISEFLTFPTFPTTPVDFTGPVLHITGETDYIVCDGYCPGIFEEPAKTIYKKSKLTRYLHPGASHNINFHYNATGAYKVITDFLGKNGL